VKQHMESRRRFLKTAGLAAGALVVPSSAAGAWVEFPQPASAAVQAANTGAADYTIRIAVSPIEIAPKRILSTVTYNGQFPGPLLR